MPHVVVEPGIRVYVDDSGGVGRPVVFLHGWPLDSRQWEYQIAALQPRGFRCVAIDDRGFGRSDRPWGHYSYDVFADDLRRVLFELELEEATLVGLSLGAGIVLRYMSRHEGDRVTQVVLCASPGGWHQPAVDELAKLDSPARLRTVSSLFLGETDDATRQWLYEMGFAGMPYATRRCLEILRDSDLEADVAALDVPTLILHGEQDRLVPRAVAERLHRAVADSRLVLLENGGHGAFFTQRERFNAELACFLDECVRPP